MRTERITPKKRLMSPVEAEVPAKKKLKKNASPDQFTNRPSSAPKSDPSSPLATGLAKRQLQVAKTSAIQKATTIPEPKFTSIREVGDAKKILANFPEFKKLKNAQDISDLAATKQYALSRTDILYAHARIFQDKKNFKESLALLNHILATQTAATPDLELAWLRFQKAMVLYLDSEEALSTHKKALATPTELEKAFKDAAKIIEKCLKQPNLLKIKEGDCKQNLAFCLQRTHQTEKALAAYLEVLKIRKAANDACGQAMTQLRIAECLADLGRPAAEVREYYEPALHYYTKEKNQFRLDLLKIVKQKMTSPARK